MFDRPAVRPSSSSDLRRGSRAPVSWRGHVLIEGRGALAARIADISAEGASVLLDEKVPLGQAVEMHFSVPRLPDMDTRELMQWHAVVVHQHLHGADWRTGLQFVDPSPSDVALLTQWIEHASKRWPG